MLDFIRKENTRYDFGIHFDYFIEKSWSRPYFKNIDHVENCLNIIRDFSNTYQRNLGFGDESLAELLQVPDFIYSKYCSDLLDILVKELIILPTYNIAWKKNNIEIGSNFILTEVYETDKLPYYYILNTGMYSWPYLLLNKDTGCVLKFYIDEILPSNTINLINGHFKELNNLKGGYYQLKFPLNHLGIEISNLDFLATPLDSLITIPEELRESTCISYVSAIDPIGTNVHHSIQSLTDKDDILFRNKIIALIEREREKENIDLPF